MQLRPGQSVAVSASAILCASIIVDHSLRFAIAVRLAALPTGKQPELRSFAC